MARIGGGHDLRETVKRFNETCNGRSTAFLPGLPYHNVWCRIADPSIPGGHADSFTTSITLHLRPEAVRRDKIVDPHHKPVDWEDPDIDFASTRPQGLSVTRHTPAPSSGPSSGRRWSTKLPRRCGQLPRTLDQ